MPKDELKSQESEIESLFEEPKDKKVTVEDPKHTVEFTRREKNLDLDINHIDTRLGSIQQYISGIDTQLTNIRNNIKTETDAGRKGRLYQVLNDCLKLASEFQSVYLKALDIKSGYRKEQNNLTLRKTKFHEIELKKQQEDDASGLNTSQLVEMVNRMNNQINDIRQEADADSKNKTKASAQLIANEFDVDEKYKLTRG